MSVPESSKSSKKLGKGGNTRQPSPAKHWFFTFYNYSEEDIKIIECHSSIDKYVFQEEKGEEEGKLHLQGTISFKTKLRPLSLGLNPNIHWEKPKSVKRAQLYCCKERTRCGRVFTNIAGLRIQRKIRVIDELRPWQTELVEVVKTEPDERTIHWIYDEKGGVGKTALAKYLVYHHEALYISGGAKDMMFAIVGFHQESKTWPKTVIMNIPRTLEGRISWAGIESIKDGLFFSAKYESRPVLMPNPHVIIFANFYPDTTKLSADRWNIKDLTPKSDKESSD